MSRPKSATWRLRRWSGIWPRSWSWSWCRTSHRARGTLLNAYSLRASDAIQLASCHLLRERLDHNVPFVAFDERLVVVARESGATVLGAAGHGLKRR